MPADSSFDQLLGRLEGVKTVLVCDPEGAILLCAGDASCEPRLQARAPPPRAANPLSTHAPRPTRPALAAAIGDVLADRRPHQQARARKEPARSHRTALPDALSPILSLQPLLSTAPVPRRHMTAFCDDCAVVHASCSPIVLSLLVRCPTAARPPPCVRRRVIEDVTYFSLSLPARSSCARSGLHTLASAPAGARGGGRRTDPRRAARAG